MTFSILLKKCDFINYADDDTLSKVSSSIDALMEVLKHHSKIAIEWFHQNVFLLHHIKV